MTCGDQISKKNKGHYGIKRFCGHKCKDKYVKYMTDEDKKPEEEKKVAAEDDKKVKAEDDKEEEKNKQADDKKPAFLKDD